MKLKDTTTILMADDDEDDRMMTKTAFEVNRLNNDLRFVEDGEELMEYLEHRGKYQDPATAPRPGLILLDLNMPRKNGHEALAEIRSSPQLRSIPIVILTTSKAEEDIVKTYHVGVNSFITKPVTFDGLVDIVKMTGRYWFEIVQIPVDE